MVREKKIYKNYFSISLQTSGTRCQRRFTRIARCFCPNSLVINSLTKPRDDRLFAADLFAPILNTIITLIYIIDRDDPHSLVNPRLHCTFRKYMLSFHTVMGFLNTVTEPSRSVPPNRYTAYSLI